MSAQKITPFLWFDTQAEEAANFYVSVFPHSRINAVSRYNPDAPQPPGPPRPAGLAMTVGFELDGVHFTALNAGPHFKFSEAISFVIHCASQEEVDHYWSALTADGGQESQCGWLKDKYGLSWQVVPQRFLELMADPDPARVGRVMGAMMQMQKLDIATLERAANEPA